MIISLISQKGGCTKSTTSVHLARYLCDLGKKVLLCDADAQMTSSRWIEGLKRSQLPCPEVIRCIDYEDIKGKIPTLEGDYDAIVLDGAGGIADVQRASLLVSDVVLIPVNASFPDLIATLETIKQVVAARNPKFRNADYPLTAYTFLARVMPNTTASRDTRAALADKKEVPLLQTEIPHRQAATRLMADKMTAFDAPKDPGAVALAKAYSSLFEEFRGV